MERRRGLWHWVGAGLSRLHQRSIFFRPHTQVLDPFVKPGSFNCARGHFRQRPHCIRAAKCTKTFLVSGADVRITRIRSCAQTRQYELSDEISLIQDINLRVCGKIPSVTDVAEYRIDGGLAGVSTILDPQVLADCCQIVTSHSGQKRLVSLRDWLHAQKRRLDHEL